jgi:hypothetical protein
MISIRAMLVLILLGDGLHRTLSKKLFQIMQRQLGWTFSTRRKAIWQEQRMVAGYT